MATSEPDVAPAAGEHSCEHCSGRGDAPDPAARALTHLGIASRRLVPRITLGVLGLGLALVLATRHDVDLGPTALAFVGGAVAWVVAAWAGVLLGSGAAGHPLASRLALGRVIAAVVTPMLLLGVSLFLPESTGRTPVMLVPGAVAVAAGWFLASAVADLVVVRGLRSRVGLQDDDGALARHQASALTLPVIQRSELVALVLAVVVGLVTAALAVLPLLLMVLAPLAGAAAALWGLRRSSARPA